MSQLQNQLKIKLNNTFGFQDFREGQLHMITTLLTKGKLLCILPTGYGKSLLYQLSATMLEGITVVISPLLALIRDQIDQLNQRFKIPAGAINSDQTHEENDFTRQAVLQDHVKILFIAPEQLDSIETLNFLLNLKVNLVVVDEAHCISTWGHDFRPSYRKILEFVHSLYRQNNSVKILGLTATANKRVETDIAKQLFFSDQEEASICRLPMDRPNIHLSVQKLKSFPAKLAACENLLHKLEGCGLIYCATRENTEIVADYLKEKGLNITSYHAGYEPNKKRELQDDFIKDKYKALAATNALGMGIDKGNLRFIIHFDFPGSITAYYQEVGRCGRDGQKANGIILYDLADKNIHEYFIDSALPSPDDFEKVLKAVYEAEKPSNLNYIKTLTGLHPTRVTIVIAELLEQKFLIKSLLNGKQIYSLLSNKGMPDLSRYIKQKEIKSLELKQMIQYAEKSEACRMHFLRTALGDPEVSACKRCDACLQQNSNPSFTSDKITSISNWINQRPVIISPMIRDKVGSGISILDGKMRLPQFIDFMKLRANSSEGSLGIDESLLILLKTHLKTLSKKHNFVGIVSIPSRTWRAREKVFQLIANELSINILDILSWKSLPKKRQGELLNNNQRQDNVFKHMQSSRQGVKEGTLLLLDDYIGSGNTIKEAARALRAAGISNELVPFTIASIKWRLGKPGFV